MKRFKEDAKVEFSLTDEQIEVHLKRGTFIEITEENFHSAAMNSINITAHAVKKEEIK